MRSLTFRMLGIIEENYRSLIFVELDESCITFIFSSSV